LQPETRNSKLESTEVLQRAKAIKLLLMDCDGVMTDGRITLLPDGDEQKTFHVRDGQGIVLCHRTGLETGIISGRTSTATKRRANELQMTYVRQDVKDKLVVLGEILSQAGVAESECAYIGDDIADIPVMRRVGLAIAVADAADGAKQAAHLVTISQGGRGAVREAVDLILKARV
jgi:3-deoxy-D-manno-octulosonate 8-phosphate phosphatase (KDO 8-P phosphatase)